MTLQAHPVADLFPVMSDTEYADLVADIRKHGLREPIWVHRDGRIIDGRNRHRACAEAGIVATQRTYEGDDDGLVSFVVSLNLKRRHLNESQRALVGGKIANLRRGRPAPTGVGTESIPSLFQDEPNEKPANLPVFQAPRQNEVAQQLNVSERSIRSARAVLEHGVPELVEKVERGEIAVSTAAVIADAPKSVQRQAIAEHGKKATVEAAKEIKKAKQLVTQAARAEPDPVQDLIDDDAFVSLDRQRQQIRLAVKAAAGLTMIDVAEAVAVMDEEMWDTLTLAVDQINTWAAKMDAASGHTGGRLAGPPQLKVVGGNS